MSIGSKIETSIYNIITNKKKGLLPNLIKLLLLPISWIFGIIVTLRSIAFDKKWMKIYKTKTPLISVGNIVVGGTGKTPFSLLLAKEISSFGKIALLSRGYRAKAEKLTQPTVVTKESHATESGDEPLLLAKNLPEALVIAGKSRKENALEAERRGAEILILDDGMQHRQMARDFEIVILDADNPFGNGYFLPRGLLREKPKALKRANLIVFNHCRNQEHFHTLCNKIDRYTTAPKIATKSHFQLVGKETLHNDKVALFSGIAQPERFHATVEKLGGIVVTEQHQADHKAFKEKELKELAQKAKALGATSLVCTEKDWVKLPKGLKLGISIVYVKLFLVVEQGENEWKAFLQEIKKASRN